MIRFLAHNLLAVDHTPASALTAGVPTRVSDGRVGIPRVDIAASELGTLGVTGLWECPSASGTLFALGDEVWYDASASLAVRGDAADLDAATDYRLGIAAAAKVSGDVKVLFLLNAQRQPQVPQTVEFEFDCDGANGDTDDHVLLQAAWNETGLIVEEIWAEVTEVFAGSTEDQGIVTIKDTADNTLATLTPSNAAADAAGDIVVGYMLQAAATGAALKKVAAGVGIKGLVTQQTSGGTPAGKLKVRVKVRPLAA